MKNTLLALMLVSTLFVISCGADSTKPQDTFKSQKTEIASGTKTAPITVSATVDVSAFARAGEKVTEIVEVYGTKKATVSSILKNPDGGIYQFNTDDTGSGSVTYKYTKTLIAPIVTKTITVSPGGSTVDMSNAPLFAFEPKVISVKDEQGNNISFNHTGNTITLYGYTTGGSVIVEYQCMDVNLISEKPTKTGSASGSQISLTATTDAGKTYVCIIGNSTYLYGIVPADGNIANTASGNYELWLY